MSANQIEISIILPCFNVIGHLEKTLNLLTKALDLHLKSWEIIVVDDGSTDNTSSVVQEFSSPSVRLLKFHKNRGKYAAIKSGIAESLGKVIIFTDSDLPYGTEPIFKIYYILAEKNADLVVGDRSHPDSKSNLKTPMLRKVASKSFSLISNYIFSIPIRDTQCGLKGFSQDLAKKLFPLIQDNRFGGDLELLYLANKYQVKIATVSVVLSSNGKSSVNLLRDSAAILSRTFVTLSLWTFGFYPKTLPENFQQ